MKMNVRHDLAGRRALVQEDVESLRAGDIQERPPEPGKNAYQAADLIRR